MKASTINSAKLLEGGRGSCEIKISSAYNAPKDVAIIAGNNRRWRYLIFDGGAAYQCLARRDGREALFDVRAAARRRHDAGVIDDRWRVSSQAPAA